MPEDDPGDDATDTTGDTDKPPADDPSPGTADTASDPGPSPTPDTTDPATDDQPVNIEIPHGDATGYVNVDIPLDQYDYLDETKDEFGLTWRGLLVHARRDLDDLPDRAPAGPNEPTHPNADKTQYELIQETRKRHGMTWKGMLLYAARSLHDASHD